MSKQKYIKKFNKNRKLKKLIFLKDAPILCTFIKRLFAFDKRYVMQYDICKDLQISSMWRCGDIDCATVMLKRKKDWDEEIKDSNIINTNKGFIVVHFLDNGWFELEALMYEKYPYRDEIKRVLNGDFSPPRESELIELEEYFQDLNEEELNVVVID